MKNKSLKKGRTMSTGPPFGDFHGSRAAAIQHALTDSLVDDTIAIVCQYAKQLRVLMLGGVCHNNTLQHTIVTYNPSTGQWETVAAARWDEVRMFAAGAVVANTLYVSTGFAGGRGRARWHRSLNLQTWTWTPFLRRAANNAYPHVVLVTPTMTHLFVLGGNTEIFDAVDRRTSLHCYDVADDRWSEKCHTNHRHKQPGGAVCGSQIYAIGGINQKAVERYDMATDQWSACSPLLSYRYACAVAVVDHQFIFACGGIAEDGNGLSSCEAYSVALDRWYTVANMLKARRFASAVYIDGQVMVCGGTASLSFSDHDTCISAETYNCPTNVWTLTSPMPCPRQRAIAVVI